MVILLYGEYMKDSDGFLIFVLAILSCFISIASVIVSIIAMLHGGVL